MSQRQTASRMDRSAARRHVGPRRRALAALALVVAGCLCAALAAPGDLDPTFSGDGMVTTYFSGSDGAAAVALQADGRIVAAGCAWGGGMGDLALARYNADGSLDVSFSGDGMLTTDFGGLDSANAVAIQGDGKIVVAGGDYSGSFVLARYHPDGSLDASFSGDGLVTTGVNGDAQALAIQGDGKIVVSGDSDGDFALVRYDASGSLDPAFSGDGVLTTDFGGPYDTAAAVALQADGRIVAAGKAGDNYTPHFALARYDPNGSLDATFSGDGKLATDFGAEDDAASAVALQADGKIVAVGRSEDGAGVGNHDFALARYNADGSLDPGFSGDGLQTTAFDGNAGASAVALQGDGRIVVGGASGITLVGSDFALARYSPDGSLDPSFSGDGMLATNLGYDDYAAGAAIQADGKIVVAGGSEGDFALARYEGDPPDNTPPDTLITLAPPSPGTDATPTFGFASTEAGSTFRCRVDSAPPGPCSSPHTTAPVAPGAHTFEVRATDRSGNADQTPAWGAFTVVADTGPVTDVTAPLALLSGATAQKAGPTVRVNVACGGEACWASATATLRVPGVANAFPLRSATVLVGKGSRAALRLKVSRQALKAVRRALKGGRKVTVKIAVRVSDAAGNTRTARRSVRLRR